MENLERICVNFVKIIELIEQKTLLFNLIEIFIPVMFMLKEVFSLEKLKYMITLEAD